MRVRMVVEMDIEEIGSTRDYPDDELRSSAIFAVHELLARPEYDDDVDFRHPIDGYTSLRVVSVRGVKEPAVSE